MRCIYVVLIANECVLFYNATRTRVSKNSLPYN